MLTPHWRKVLLCSCLFAALTVLGTGLARVAAKSATEAPAGFNTPSFDGAQSLSNGIVEPPGDTYARDQEVYEENHSVQTGLGPVYNATACVSCHQNPNSGGASQFTELRVGHNDENGNFVNRALVGWLVVSILAALLYQGGQSAHALWFTLPLAGLSAVAIDKALRPVYDQFWNVPTWGPWLHGLAVVAMLAIIGVNLVIIGRAILLASPEQFPSLSDQDRLRLLFDIPAILLVVITFFLVGSMWGNRAAWRGMGIGVLIFLSIFTFSQGWRAAVVNADDPRELWRVNPAARNLNLLEQTLTTASRRVDGMPYSTELVVQTNSDVTAEDGALAWVLRKFKTQYVTALAPSTNAPVIILPASVQSPAVAAAYVGQDFPVYYTWNRTTLSWDLLSWYYERATRVPVQSGQRIVVWVRSDIYGVPTDTNPGAPVNPPTQP